MTDLNVDDFFKDAGRALSRLYATFPRPVAVYVEDICGAEETDEFGMHSDRFLSCFSTLLWLGDEGYVRYEDTIRQEAVDQVVLSGRAFTVLSVPVEDNVIPALAERATRLARLREALNARSSALIREAMLAIMTAMPPGATAGRRPPQPPAGVPEP